MRVAFFVAVLLASFPLAASDIYLRAGVGWDRSESTVHRDRDCSSTQPPALFGCGFEARGHLEGANRWELGIGIDRGAGRVVLALSHRDLDLNAAGNFTGVTGSQDVTARGRSRAAMVIAWMAGAGVSMPVTGSVFLDLAVRHQDNGAVRTEQGPATIIRPRGTVVLDVAATRARVRSTGAMLSVRFRL